MSFFFKNLTTLKPFFFEEVNDAFDIEDALVRAPIGVYAQVIDIDNVVILRRDLLGSHKLFYGKNSQKIWVIANRIHDLLSNDVHCSEIHSCPPGGVIELKANQHRLLFKHGFDFNDSHEDFEIIKFQKEVKSTLENTFIRIKNEHPGAVFVVCLSGGMDSTVIASYAKKFLPNITAWCFSFYHSYSSNNDSPQPTTLSDDFKAAKKIAHQLKIPFMGAYRERSAVIPALKKAIELGQDWRDFNAHCAVVNLFLAEDLSTYYKNKKVVVLTGDLMNEYVCDYSEEIIDGHTYYKQPRVSNFYRRKFLIKGLDAGDREVGIFNYFDITTIQPYASVCQNYIKIPSEYLDASDAKYMLNAPLLSDDVICLLNAKKTRAQVGGEDGGVLRVCHQNGIQDKKLINYWCSTFPDASPEDMIDLIHIGAYRS